MVGRYCQAIPKLLVDLDQNQAKYMGVLLTSGCWVILFFAAIPLPKLLGPVTYRRRRKRHNNGFWVRRCMGGSGWWFQVKVGGGVVCGGYEIYGVFAAFRVGAYLQGLSLCTA